MDDEYKCVKKKTEINLKLKEVERKKLDGINNKANNKNFDNPLLN